MNYELNLGAWNRVFAVPAAVVDQHLRLAGSAQLKVLLWLLRYAGEPCDPETIGQAIGLARADVCDAMQYWIAAGLICAQDGALTPPPRSTQAMPAAPEPAAAADPAPAPIVGGSAVAAAAAATLPEPLRRPARPKQLNPAEIAARVNGTEEVRCLLDGAEAIFGRPLTTPEMGALINLYDWDGMPADVIIMIIQYAAGNGKCNMGYIEKMAISWAKEGVTTHERAEEKVRLLDERKEYWSRVCRLFGIDKRPPSAYETEAVMRWLQDWHFDDDMLREAYNRCVDSTGKLKFQYINKILERWHKEGIYTVGAAIADANGKKTISAAAGGARKPAAEQQERSYDLDEFEKMALYGDRPPQHETGKE